MAHFVKVVTACILWLLPVFAPAQTWTLKSPTLARSQGFSFTIDGNIYAGGGKGSGIAFQQYNPSSNTWVNKANIPGSLNGRLSPVGFSINGKGYMGLGVDSTFSTFYTDLWEYDPTTNSWTQKASLPAFGRESSACFVIDNKAYIVGGANASATNQTWQYDPASDSWTAKAHHPLSFVTDAMAFSLANLGYIACGFSGSTVTNSMYAYDPAANSWSARAAFPGTERQGGVAFTLYNKAYVGLGRGFSLFTTYDDLFAYNATTNTWSAAGTFPGNPKYDMVVETVDSVVYLGSGSNAANALSDWWKFSAGSNAIATVENSNGISCYPTPAAGKLYIRLPEFTLNELSVYAIYSATGNKISSGYLTNAPLDITGLSSGEYILKVTTSGTDMTTKIIVQH